MHVRAFVPQTARFQYGHYYGVSGRAHRILPPIQPKSPAVNPEMLKKYYRRTVATRPETLGIAHAEFCFTIYTYSGKRTVFVLCVCVCVYDTVISFPFAKTVDVVM